MGLNLCGVLQLGDMGQEIPACPHGCSRAVQAAGNRLGEVPRYSTLYCTNLMFPASSCLSWEASVPGLPKNMSLGNRTYHRAHLLTQLAWEHFPPCCSSGWRAELRC